MLPTLSTAIQHLKASTRRAISGEELLMFMLIGYDIGSHVGKALCSDHILSMEWHPGAAFGLFTCIASAGKLSMMINLTMPSISRVYKVVDWCQHNSEVMSSICNIELLIEMDF